MSVINLFDEKSNQLESKRFYVMVGETVLLTAFGFGGNVAKSDAGFKIQQSAIVQKMAFANGIYPTGDGCSDIDAFKLAQEPTTYIEDVTQCGTWCLNACQNTVLLNVPGTYRLRLNDKAALGNVLIQLVRFDTSIKPTGLPRALYLGEQCNG